MIECCQTELNLFLIMLTSESRLDILFIRILCQTYFVLTELADRHLAVTITNIEVALCKKITLLKQNLSRSLLKKFESTKYSDILDMPMPNSKPNHKKISFSLD